MPKTCEASNCDNPRFGKGYCKWHQYLRTDKKPKQKSYNSFKPISDKRTEELAIYRPLRDKYLAEHPVCEVKDCNNSTTNLHHKNGRLGKMVYNTAYFMACCHLCHPKRIHENPEWARENGYLV